MIWLHRISHCAEVSYPLLDEGYLSIGWSDFSKPEFIKKSLGENGRNYFNKTIQNEWGNLPRNRYSLWHFIAEMKTGDWVVVPKTGTFSIFEITDDNVLSVPELLQLTAVKDLSGNAIEMGKNGYLYKKGGAANDPVDLGFFRRIKPVATEIPRYDYADAALTARMKIRQASADISDLKGSVEKALATFKQEKLLNIYSRIVETASQQILDAIRSELTPDKFEQLVKWYFERIGATNVDIPVKNESGKEGDADVVAVFEPIKTIIYTRVKFHLGETSAWAIEQITNYKLQKEGTVDGYSKIAWVISSSDSFSEEARKSANTGNVQLFDGPAFATMLLEAGIANLNGAL
ncbi:MAG: restriction endonuclease [Tannerella sp.]|jgi:predicted Mrr-cat superfamily restriction endonuclease|nr:restriction endonuclease [Tannerella sp.]